MIMKFLPRRFRALAMAVAMACVFLSTDTASGANLYATDFSTFPAGDDQLVGFDSWKGNSVGLGVHGIGDGMAPGFGKSAWIGYGEPNTNRVRVYREFTTGQTSAAVYFEAVVGISPSILGGDDTFAVAFYNTSGAFLASIQFDTSVERSGIWRRDGTSTNFTATYFPFYQLFLLGVEIDFQQNVWSASIGGAPVFQKARFHAGTAARNAGNFSIEWLVFNTAFPGDNWLLFDDILVTTPDLKINLLERLTGGNFRLHWTAPRAANYQVEFSQNLVNWTNLSGALVQATNAGQTISYTDTSAGSSSHKFYRIKQQ